MLGIAGTEYSPNLTFEQKAVSLAPLALSFGTRGYAAARSFENRYGLDYTLAEAKVNAVYRPGGLMSLGGEGQTAVIGSGMDVAKYSFNRQYNIFSPSAPKGKMTQLALDADNTIWAEAAATRSLAGRGPVHLVTNPGIHRHTMLQNFGTVDASALFRVELPYFQQRGVNVVPNFASSPGVQ
jgi:hypothetical protein